MTSLNENITDVQSRHDSRNLAISKVGIKDIRHPLKVASRDKGSQQTVANSTLSISLKADVKGTHMSRFVALLEENDKVITVKSFTLLLQAMVQKLDAEVGEIKTDFTFFHEKSAPVSGVKSLLDYQVSFIGSVSPYASQVDVKVVVPITSLCPCSKEISAYGAHNQRSHVTVRLRLSDEITIEEIIERVEKHASCELYGLLKRADEKYVTEKAYDNPKFVEDLVRDIAMEFNNDPKVSAYQVESENFESIHNHSAYAMIDKLS